MSTAPSTPSGGWSVNARFAAAVLLTIARARQAPEEMLLRDRLKATLNLPDNVWSVFAEVVRRERRRFERRSLKSLMGESPLRKAVAALKQMEPRTDGVFQAVTEWAAGTETGGAALCHACDNNVAAGFACGGCGKEWHGACAWLQLMDCNATSILSADDVFVANTRSQITCMMCRQLPGRRVARKDALLSRFSDWIERLEVCDAEAVVDACVRAGPSRRQLPGSDSSVSAGSARWLAAAAAGILVEHVEGGDRAAELLLLHFPRLILRKGSRPEEQLTELIERKGATPFVARNCDPVSSWAAACEAAERVGSVKRLVQLLEQGPRSRTARRPAPGALAAYYPRQDPFRGEEKKWKDLRGSIPAARDRVSAADLKKWARLHPHSTGGTTGWTGRLILQLGAVDPKIAVSLAMLWGRPPEDWLWCESASRALRDCDAFPVPKGDGYRPITAPAPPRRFTSGFFASKARPLAERYCRQRHQLGLSGEAYTITYSLLPLLVSETGGTVVTADRSMSFQTLRRAAVYDAVKEVVAEATGSEQTSAAALVDGCVEFYSDHSHMRRTTARLDDGTEYRVDGVAQGCALSPILEAVTLAKHLANATRDMRGAALMMAHDDLVIAAEAGAPISRLRLPSCPEVGGTYNASKSVAVGADASTAVAVSLASTAAQHVTVWGRPVGDVSAWFKDVWLRRYMRRCDSLRTLARNHGAVAAWAAHLLRGPGGSAQHVLRGMPIGILDPSTPTGQRIRSILHEADEEWIDVMLAIASGLPCDGEVVRAAVRLRVFGAPLWHLSAEAIADKASADGMDRAVPVLLGMAEQAGLEVRRWSDLLGLPELAQHDGCGPLPQSLKNSIGATLAERKRAATEAYEGRFGRPPEDNDDWWVEAVKAPGPLHDAAKAACASAALPETRDAAVRLAVARCLGVSVWHSIASSVPLARRLVRAPACGRCSAAASVLADAPTMESGGVDGGRAGGAAFAAPRPRATLDAYGDHVSACVRAPRSARNDVRHDRMVRVLTAVAVGCGVQARVHDGPIFEHREVGTIRASKARPADWFERGSEVTSADAARYYAGRCGDLTIRTGGRPAVAAAEAEKERKYRQGMQTHPHLGLSIFSVGTGGEIGAGAATTMTRWAVNLARKRKAAAELAGSPVTEIKSAIGHGLAVVTYLQLRAFAESSRNDTYMGSDDACDVGPVKRRPPLRTSGVGGRLKGARMCDRPLAHTVATVSPSHGGAHDLMTMTGMRRGQSGRAAGAAASTDHQLLHDSDGWATTLGHEDYAVGSVVNDVGALAAAGVVPLSSV